MRVGLYGENLLERAALAAGIVPRPFAETMFTMLLARSVMVACKVGVFGALAAGPLTAEEVARRTATDRRAIVKLLDALVASRYLRHGRERYSLAPVARRWLVPGTAASLHDSVLFRFVEWELLDEYEDFLRDGRPLDIHERFDDVRWAIYQRGMRATAAVVAPLVARALPLQPRATTMLDVGGSHGAYSVHLCRRYPQLHATILELPEAVRHAAPLLAGEGMNDRVVYRLGDALRDDLGESAYDLVFISLLVHHFDESTNRALVRRAARALRPGGLFAVLEPLRPSSPRGVGQGAALLDLYFALTSGSGTWSLDEIQAWQSAAGLAVERPLRFRRAPGMAVVVARKR